MHAPGVLQYKGQPGNRHNDDAQVLQLSPKDYGRQGSVPPNSNAYSRDHVAIASMSNMNGIEPGVARRRHVKRASATVTTVAIVKGNTYGLYCQCIAIPISGSVHQFYYGDRSTHLCLLVRISPNWGMSRHFLS